MELLRHAAVIADQLLEFGRREHQGITAQRQQLQRPMAEAFMLRPLSKVVDQQQIEVTAHRGRTAAVATKQTNPPEAWVQALLLLSPPLGLLQDLLRAGPSQNRLRQLAHGYG